MHRWLFALSFAASASLVTLPAHAQTASREAIDPTGWSVAALLGFGVNNDVGFGLGARGGYTFDNHVYVGGTLLDHFGDDGLNLLLLGGEAGYDFIAGPVVIRAYGGLGFAVASISVGGTETVTTPTGTTTEGSSVSTSSTNVVFWPGATVIYTFPQNPRFFVGGDARVYLVSGFSTFATYGFGGIHF
jgi:hypothetical protein